MYFDLLLCCKCGSCGVKSHRLFRECDGCNAIIFDPKIINSVHTLDDDISGKGAQLNLVTNRED